MHNVTMDYHLHDPIDAPERCGCHLSLDKCISHRKVCDRYSKLPGRCAWEHIGFNRHDRDGSHQVCCTSHFVTSVLELLSGDSYQYTGRENDGTGLYFYRARYYAPALGRFISEDPIGFRGGINRYAYVGDSPLNFVDPHGMDKNDTRIHRIRRSLNRRSFVDRFIFSWDRCYWVYPRGLSGGVFPTKSLLGIGGRQRGYYRQRNRQSSRDGRTEHCGRSRYRSELAGLNPVIGDTLNGITTTYVTLKRLREMSGLWELYR